MHYRPHETEPSFDTDRSIRLLIGFSGSGKTTWAAQGSQHSASAVAYFDVGDMPASGIASQLAREVAAILSAGSADQVRKVRDRSASHHYANVRRIRGLPAHPTHIFRYSAMIWWPDCSGLWHALRDIPSAEVHPASLHGLLSSDQGALKAAYPHCTLDRTCRADTVLSS
jgi:hypothetical protein